jgi:hypothetical protein
LAQQWYANLGSSGKILVLGAAFGVVACFLPLIRWSAEVLGATTSHSWLVIEDWRGKLCLVGYLVAAVLALLMYLPGKSVTRMMCVGVVAVGAFLALFALWLLVDAFRSGGSVSTPDMASGVSPGLGVIVNLLTAITVAAGAYFKAHEEKVM